MNLATLTLVAAHAKLTYRRGTRLFSLLVFGETFEASCRAIGVSSTAVRKKANRDARFAHRLKAARENRAPGPPPLEELDWRELAEQLEREDPLGSHAFIPPWASHLSAT
jgi:hypothetical protein